MRNLLMIVLTIIIGIVATASSRPTFNEETYQSSFLDLSGQGVINNVKDNIDINNPQRLNTIILSLLTPEIQNAINNYYEAYLNIHPKFEAFFGTSKIVDIQGDILSSLYQLRIEVEPYVGPHISVGRDRILVEVYSDGTASVKDFTHLESYELPPNLHSLIRKPLP